MRVELAGQMAIRDGDRLLDDTRLPGRQGRVVLACLALHAAPVHRDVLAEALWPEGLPTTWERTLSGVVSRLRTALASAGFDDVQIANAFGCYELQLPPGAELDTAAAEKAAETAERALAAGDPSSAARAAGAAVAIARRTLLPGEDAHWLEASRSDLRAIRVAALETWARATLGTPDAVVAAQEAVDVEPFREQPRILLIRAHAALGETTRALLAYERWRELLSSELGVDPSAEAHELHLEILAADEDAAARAAAADRGRARARRAHAPIAKVLARQRTNFVGRYTEITAVAKLIGPSRLVTLVGPGGIGKTRLAVQVAAAQSGTFRDGAFFCDLSPLRDPTAIPRTIAEAIGALDPLAETGREDHHAAASALERHLVDELENAEALFVLDNCEHLLDEAARFADLVLDNCPGVVIVATSREPLAVRGESLYRVGPMSAPSDGDPLASDAVRLFGDRARDVHSDFALGPHNADAISEICRKLDGIPLALELAAARLNGLSPSHIAQRLSDLPELLASGLRSPPERHKTIDAAIEWSHQLLSDEDAILFRRLATFVGGFSLEGAERVCGSPPLDRAGIRPLLSRLVDRSFVVRDAGDAPERYRMLEPLRQFAEAKLCLAREDENVRDAHSSYFLSVSDGITSGLQVDYDRLPVIRPELDNFTAALDRYARRGEAARAMQLAMNTYGLWRFVGRPTDAKRWLESALSLADERPSLLRAACLGFVGEAHLHSGDVKRAHASFERAEEIFRERSFPLGLAWVEMGIADTHRVRGDVDAMRRACAESAECFRQTGDSNGVGWALANHSRLAFSCDELDEAVRLADEIEALGEGAPPEPLNLQRGLSGVIAAMNGDVARGRDRYETALRWAEESSSRLDVHYLAMVIGTFEVTSQDLRSSGRARLHLALEIAREGGFARPVPWILEPAAACATAEGRTSEAARLFGAAKKIMDGFGDRTQLAPFREFIEPARAECALDDDFATGSPLTLSAAAELGLDVLANG